MYRVVLKSQLDFHSLNVLVVQTLVLRRQFRERLLLQMEIVFKSIRWIVFHVRFLIDIACKCFLQGELQGQIIHQNVTQFNS